MEDDDLEILGKGRRPNDDHVYIRGDTTSESDSGDLGRATSGYTSTRSVSEASSVLPLTALLRNGTCKDVIRGVLSRNTADVNGGVTERIHALHRELTRGDEMLLQTGIGPGALAAVESKIASKNRPGIAKRMQATSGTADQIEDVRRTRIAQRFELFSKMPSKPIKKGVEPPARVPLRDKSRDAANRAPSSVASTTAKSRDSLVRDAYRVGLKSNLRAPSTKANTTSVRRASQEIPVSQSDDTRPSTPAPELIPPTPASPFVVSHRLQASPPHSASASSPKQQKQRTSMSPARSTRHLDEAQQHPTLDDESSSLSWREENLKWSAAWTLRPSSAAAMSFADRSLQHVAVDDVAARWRWLRWEA